MQPVQRLATILVTAISLVSLACGSQSTPAPAPAPAPGPTPPGTGLSPDSPISVAGTERIGWDQAASDLTQASGYQYNAYVDDVPAILDAACQTGTASTFSCAARLPHLQTGLHKLELTATGNGVESPRSSPIYVTLAAAAATKAIPGVVTTVDGTRRAIDIVETGLDAPSALAMTGDGRIFIAQSSGIVSVWRGGRVLAAPALVLRDSQRLAGIGLIGMTLDPQFEKNGRVYVAYVARRADGSLVNRIMRFRELGDVFGEAVVLLEDDIAALAPQPARIRFGPDQKLYAAFPAADWPTVDSYSSYAGKILRLNDDGTTPRDNPRTSPIVSMGHAATGGLGWQPGSGRLWLAEHDRQGRDVLGFLSPAFQDSMATAFDSIVGASGTAFYSATAFAAFANDMFIAGAAGQQLRRVHFSPADTTRIASSERLLEGQFGRFSDVIVGADGSLYLCTSNKGLSSAAPDDDRLLRLSAAKP